MKSIVKIMKECLDMPYYRNYQAVSGKAHNSANHEKAVERVLIENNYKESNVLKKYDTKKKKWICDKGKVNRDLWLKGEMTKEYYELESNSYISQPCGQNDSPDFIIKDENGELFFLECKSAKGGTPMYNSGVPKSKYIYIFASGKHDDTTVYMGEDCLPPEVAQKIEEHISEARKRDEVINEILARHEVVNDYNISYYTRPMLQHTGGIKKGNDYFINENRVINEANVFAFIQRGA